MAFNRNDPADLATLKTEVATDPLALGYDPEGLGTQDLLNKLNAKNYTVSKPMINSDDVKDATTYDAFQGLLDPEEVWLQWQTIRQGIGDNMAVTAELRQKLAGDPISTDSIWAAADRAAMNAAMLALMDVPGSRAEVLFGYGTMISRDDWFAARDS